MDNKTLDRVTRFERRPVIRDMILDNKVSRMTVIATITEGLKLYPDKADYVFHSLLQYVIAPHDTSVLGSYPELLWLAHASGLLSNTVENIFDTAQLLVRIIGHKLARSYFNYLLLSGSKNDAKIIIPAYYYTHHDMESLRLSILFVSEDDPNLTYIIYANAIAFVASLGENQLPQDDIDFLIAFFEKGLTHRTENVHEYSRQALEILKKN